MYNKSVSNNSNYGKNYGNSTGWIEKEIQNIKKSYEEEIKLLEVNYFNNKLFLLIHQLTHWLTKYWFSDLHHEWLTVWLTDWDF